MNSSTKHKISLWSPTNINLILKFIYELIENSTSPGIEPRTSGLIVCCDDHSAIQLFIFWNILKNNKKWGDMFLWMTPMRQRIRKSNQTKKLAYLSSWWWWFQIQFRLVDSGLFNSKLPSTFLTLTYKWCQRLMNWSDRRPATKWRSFWVKVVELSWLLFLSCVLGLHKSLDVTDPEQMKWIQN